MPSDPLEIRYLDLETAGVLVEAIRDVTTADGHPSRVPPVPLSACDEVVLRSSFTAPMTRFQEEEKYPDLASKGAALLYALAKAQACIDGNKRLALICVVGFFRLNGWDMPVSNTEMKDQIERVAASEAEDRDLIVEELREWFHYGLRRML